MEKFQESIHTRRSSGSDGDDKGLKRKLADRATSHGPGNGDVPKTLEEAETLKRSRNEDDNPRAKKRPTPPRTPEAASGQKSTPPATPPSDSDELPKPNEALKRPRDDGDNDDNPRQTKKPSPPPEKILDKEATATAPKLVRGLYNYIEDVIPLTVLKGGFMAYASTSSPFASVKGQNIFGGSSKLASLSKGPSTTSPSPSPSTAKLPLASPFATPSQVLGDPSASTPTATKRTGFEAFSGSVSPFASFTRAKSPTTLGSNAVRPKSPSRRIPATKNVNAFTSYATGGTQAFAVPMPKRARAGSPDGSSRSSLERNSTLGAFGTQEDEDEEYSRRDEGQLSFGEKLRAGKNAEEASDEDAKPELTAQEGINLSSVPCRRYI
jgi:Ran-binding protein 3